MLPQQLYRTLDIPARGPIAWEKAKTGWGGKWRVQCSSGRIAARAASPAAEWRGGEARTAAGEGRRNPGSLFYSQGPASTGPRLPRPARQVLDALCGHVPTTGRYSDSVGPGDFRDGAEVFVVLGGFGQGRSARHSPRAGGRRCDVLSVRETTTSLRGRQLASQLCGASSAPARTGAPNGRRSSMSQPHKLKCWKPRDRCVPGRLFTCARPGRTKCEKSKYSAVPDKVVRGWVKGLPERRGTLTVIVSLLGRKPDGQSEYSFYSFHGDVDAPERSEYPHFRDWLAREFPDRDLVLEEHPTCDFRPIPDEQLRTISERVNELQDKGRTVILVDSGGVQRTGQVCRYLCSYLGFVEDTTWRHDPS